jgi:hypothetical protein
VSVPATRSERRRAMRSILLWLLGVPLSIIVLLNVFNVL